MGKSSQKQIVTEYRLSVHFGISTPVDELLAIEINDKVAWSGSMTAAGDVWIDRLDLFGGIKQEGGIQGMLSFLPGGPDQVMPEFLAARLGYGSDICPAFRGVASFWLTGGANREGCVWSYNNPIVAQTVKAKVRRTSVGLDPSLARIGPDSNPAHMIYECLTNADWGMGASTTSLDTAAFTACAQALFDEEFGLSMVWRDQMKIEDFVSEILDHIQAMVYVNPRNGLLTIKLLRDDYDFNSLRVITPDNADLSNFQRKMWGETINEIVVTWTNPENEQEETVAIQDLANIGIQGAPVSDGRNYYAIRNSALASRVAARDIRTSAAPLATADALLDRSAWDIHPGEVVRLTWPEYELEDIVARVGQVDYGRPGDPMVKVSLLEDVFSLLKPDPRPAPDTEWQNPSEPPRPVDYAQVITLPAFFITSSDYVTADFDLAYPEVVAAVLAAQDSKDTATYELLTEQVSTTGAVSYATAGTKTIVGRTTLDDGLVPEASSLLPAALIADTLRGPQVNGFVFIGNIVDDGGSTESTPLALSGETGNLLLSGYGAGEELLVSESSAEALGEALTEIALVESFDSTNYVLARGVLDTIPRFHAPGTPMWFVNPGARFSDEIVVRSAGETVDYKVQTRTSQGLLAEADAPVETGVLTARPHLPYRPANVTVNGVGFGNDVALSGSDITITWATRNRLLEDTQVMRWGEGAVPPEYLQETIVSVYDDSGTLLVYEQTGLWVETSLILPASYFARYETIFIVVRARRSGLWSLQGQVTKVTGLPGNPAADPPPAAPDPGPAPGVGPAPADYQWTATPSSQTSNGTSLPIIVVDGSAADNPEAQSILIEYRPEGDSTWNTVVDAPPQSTRVVINQVKGGTNYYVAVSYKLNGIYGNRLVLGPILTTGVTTPGGGGGSGGGSLAPVSVSWTSNVGYGAARHVVAETADMTVGSSGGQLSVNLSATADADIVGFAVGSWQLYTVTSAGESMIASGGCGYDDSVPAGSPVGDFSKLNPQLFPVSPGAVRLRLYVSGGGPSSSASTSISGSMLGIVYNN